MLNKSAQELSRDIIELLNVNVSQEKLVSQITIENSKSHNNNAIAFVEYQREKKHNNKKFNFLEFINKSKTATLTLSKKIILISKKIFNFVKKNFQALKAMDKKKLRNRILLVLASILIVFFVFFFRNKQKQKTITTTQSSITNILSKMDNIEKTVETEPITARQISDVTLSELEELNKITDNRDAKKLIENEIEKIQQLINEISGENSLDRLSVAYDLSQKSPQFLAEKIKIKNDSLYVLEKNGQEILKINLNDPSKKIQSLKLDTTVRDFSINEEGIYFLENGISFTELSKIPEEDSELNNLEQLKEEGDSDRTGLYLNSYGPYLYLVNPEKRNIYRYYHNNDQLSDPIGWLINKEGVSFDNISHLMVNGDVYLTFKSGKIMKFEKGEALDFQVQGLENPFESSIIIAGQEEIDKIAVLEKKNKRIVILSNEGQVFSEIKSNELAAVNDLAISKDASIVYAISGSIIYQIKL